MNVTATLIGQMLTFGVLVWFIWKFLWDPMTTMLEDRKKRIADGLAAAERGVHEQQMAEAKAKEVLKEAKQQAAEIIAQAQKRHSEIVDGAKEDARAEGERLLEAARAEIDQEANRAREALRSEVVKLAVAGAGKVIGREIDAKAHADLLDELVAQI
ncbi:F0F1 ATP synthase subunit B [Endothiovibrio diazotrophicus]